MLPVGNLSLMHPHCAGVLQQEGTCAMGAVCCMLFGPKASVLCAFCGRGKMGPWVNALFAQRKRILMVLPIGNSSLMHPQCASVLKQEDDCAIGAACFMLFGSQTTASTVVVNSLAAK